MSTPMQAEYTGRFPHLVGPEPGKLPRSYLRTSASQFSVPAYLAAYRGSHPKLTARRARRRRAARARRAANVLQVNRLKSMTQFVSHDLPASGEKACAQRGASAVGIDHRNRTWIGFPFKLPSARKVP